VVSPLLVGLPLPVSGSVLTVTSGPPRERGRPFFAAAAGWTDDHPGPGGTEPPAEGGGGG
jgi:hypothetical protein